MSEELCGTCKGTGVNATRIDDNDHYYYKCPECGGTEVTHYVAKKGFHFKLVDAMVINVEPDTWFRLDDDGWVHSIRSHGLEIRLSAPMKFIRHHLTKVEDDDEATSDLINLDATVDSISDESS